VHTKLLALDTAKDFVTAGRTKSIKTPYTKVGI